MAVEVATQVVVEVTQVVGVTQALLQGTQALATRQHQRIQARQLVAPRLQLRHHRHGTFSVLPEGDRALMRSAAGKNVNANSLALDLGNLETNILRNPMSPCQEMISSFVNLSKLNGLQAPVAFNFLHEHGRIFLPQQEQSKIPGKKNLCYMNAYKGMNLRHLYCEGYAMKPGLIPLSHAWLVKGGLAVDPTWKDSNTSSYFGCIFKTSFVHEIADRTGYYGIFEGLYLLRMDPDECYEYLASGLE